VKEEDTDWLIYHLIASGHGAAVEDLIDRSGLDRGSVEASVGRLEHYLLIQKKQEKIEALPVNKMLIWCQIRYDTLLPFTIENGVIRTKRGQDP
jgi:hypothetical protein